MALYYLFFRLMALVRDHSGSSVAIFAVLSLPPLRYLYRHPISHLAQRRVAIAGIITAALIVGGFALGMARYTASNILSDHVESNVISLSDVWGTRHPLYGSLASAERYSLLYGPNLFILDRASMSLLGPSIQSAKLPEALLAGLSIILLFWLYRAESSAGIAIFCLAYCILAIETLSGIWSTSLFWARGEPYIVFSTVLALVATRVKHQIPAIILLGVAMGFTVNIKLHSLIFLLPAVALFTQQRGFFKLSLALVIAAIVACLPFALPGVSLPNYLVWLQVAGSHPLIHGMIPGYVRAGFIVFLPLAAIFRMAWIRQPAIARTFLRNNVLFFAACAVAAGINIIPAMKLGSGGYHFLPFAPLLGFILCRLLLQMRGEWSSLLPADVPLAALVCAAILVMTAKLLIDERDLNELNRDGGAWATDIIDEIKAIEREHPRQTIAMGYGDTIGYLHDPVTDYRTQAAFDHEAYPLDAVSIMDTQLAGKPLAPATLDYLKSGRVSIWLIPRGSEPFSMVRVNESASSAKIFDAKFRQIFFQCYRSAAHTPHFDLWESIAPPNGDGFTLGR